MSVIIDGILHNPDDVQQKDVADGAEKWEDFDGKPFGRFIIDFVEENLRTNGDWNFTVNADLGR